MFQREAKIIARLLIRKDGYLVDDRSRLGEKNWFLMGKKTKKKTSGSKVSSDVVIGMQEKGWLKKDPVGGWRLSQAGLLVLVPSSSKDEFASQHQLRRSRTIKDQQGITKSVLFNEGENPLGWMRARRDKAGNPLINDEQFEAGERLRKDYTIAQMTARVTSNWDFSGTVSSGKTRNNVAGIEISERAMAARQRFLNALDDLGAEMANIVFDVCCIASGLEAAERRLGWPRRSGKLVLQIALTKLSIHYGIARPENTKPGASVIDHWGQQGYRPQIPPAGANPDENKIV